MTQDEGDLINRLWDEVRYLRGRNEDLERKLNTATVIIEEYKQWINKISEIQAEVLLTQPMQPIIIKRSELGLDVKEQIKSGGNT